MLVLLETHTLQF